MTKALHVLETSVPDPVGYTTEAVRSPSASAPARVQPARRHLPILQGRRQPARREFDGVRYFRSNHVPRPDKSAAVDGLLDAHADGPLLPPLRRRPGGAEQPKSFTRTRRTPTVSRRATPPTRSASRSSTSCARCGARARSSRMAGTRTRADTRRSGGWSWTSCAAPTSSSPSPAASATRSSSAASIRTK